MIDALALGIIGFSALSFLIAIALYILFAGGLFTLAMRRNLANAWMAWIPIAQIYTVGEVIGPVKLGDNEITQTGLYLLITLLALWVLSLLPVLGVLFSLTSLVLGVAVMYFLFSRYTAGSTPVVYTVLSVLLPFMGPIFVFLIRNNEYRLPEAATPA